MSLLGARNGSLLGAPVGSQLGVYGTGFKTLLTGISTDVAMTWEISFARWKNPGNQVLQTVGGTVSFHQRMYHVLLWLWGSSQGRGVAKVDRIKVQGYSAGSPDTINDETDSNGFTLGDHNSGFMQFNGWSAAYTDTALATPPVIDTGSAMEMYGEFNLNASSIQTLTGSYMYDPRVAASKFAFPPNDDVFPDVRKWIVGYLEPASSLTIGTGEQVRVRLKVTVTG